VFRAGFRSTREPHGTIDSRRARADRRHGRASSADGPRHAA
jgi:hypothetical protein